MVVSHEVNVKHANIMEITKRGTPKEKRTWYGKCQTCDSEAIAEELEMTKIIFDQREGAFFSWERCPVCGYGDGNDYSGMLFHPKV